MVDGFKAKVLNSKEVLLNDLFNFKMEVIKDSGEITKWIANHKGLKLTLIMNVLTIQGSIHKYYNDGGVNSDDFGVVELNVALSRLSNELRIDLDRMKIRTIEFGVNLELDHRIKPILNNLLLLKTKAFDSQHNGHYRFLICDEFIFKVYDKSHQTHKIKNPLNNILRVEINAIRSRLYEEKLKLETMQDLFDDKWYLPAQEFLIQKWGETLMFEPKLIESKINKLDVANWKSVNYWQSLKGKKKEREIKKFKKAVGSNPLDIHTVILNAIESKCMNLLKNGSNKHFGQSGICDKQNLQVNKSVIYPTVVKCGIYDNVLRDLKIQQNSTI